MPKSLKTPRKSKKTSTTKQAEITAEQQRVEAQSSGEAPWRRWGPYLSERQWGTVREDYSEHGEAWESFSHDQARSRAYRWGEDGIAGFSDDMQKLCLGLALWNGNDPILKERLYGLTNSEANHGEDVKELYYYLDATPSHSYLKMLYKYPQAEFPYAQIVAENGRRGKEQPEFELMDTGIFDDDRYFDVFVEYAKADTDDILMRITAHNRGDQAAPLHILPQLWFRNTWAWGYDATRPALSALETDSILVEHPTLGNYHCHFDVATKAGVHHDLLFCDNDTNTALLYGQPTTGHSKDAFHEYVIHANHHAVNPSQNGTKAAGHFNFTVPAHDKVEVCVRLTKGQNKQPFKDFNKVFDARLREADDFYATLQTDLEDDDAKLIQRQALAGMIWSKQFYYYDIPQWLEGDPAMPAPPQGRRNGRNKEWKHLNNADIIAMPDKWEYPWYAVWDLAFHCVPLAMIRTLLKISCC